MGFNVVVVKADGQTTKFNFPPNFPAIQYAVINMAGNTLLVSCLSTEEIKFHTFVMMRSHVLIINAMHQRKVHVHVIFVVFCRCCERQCLQYWHRKFCSQSTITYGTTSPPKNFKRNYLTGKKKVNVRSEIPSELWYPVFHPPEPCPLSHRCCRCQQPFLPTLQTLLI